MKLEKILPFLNSLEREYQKHKKVIHGISGLGLTLIIAMYFYDKYKQSQIEEPVNE